MNALVTVTLIDSREYIFNNCSLDLGKDYWEFLMTNERYLVPVAQIVMVRCVHSAPYVLESEKEEEDNNGYRQKDS